MWVMATGTAGEPGLADTFVAEDWDLTVGQDDIGEV